MQLSLSYPWWFILFCIIIGIGFSYLMYHKDARFLDKPTWLRNLLKILRFLSGFGISFLLLAPIFKDETTEKKDPLVVFLTDQSSSVATATSKDNLSSFKTEIEKQKDKIRSKFEVVDLGFGESTFDYEKDTFNQKITNISQALEYVYDTYSDQNIGSIVLISDGIYNEGSNPIYSNAKFSSPIYTIGLGDTTIRKDLAVNDILSNKIAYLGDKFAIQVGISSKNATNVNSKVTVYTEDDNGNKRQVAEKVINVKSNNEYQTFDFIIEANKTGVAKYSTVVSSVSGENNIQNNSKDFYVEIIDARIKILIYANGPHPDIGALFSIIEENKNYEVTSAFSYDNVVVSNYDFVIFHNLPSATFDISNQLKQLDNKGVNRLFFVGNQIDQNKFNVAQSVINLSGNSANTEIIEPNVVGNFDKFVISEELKNRFVKYPPFTAPFGSFKAGSFTSVLLNQKVKKIPTQNPMIAFEDKNGKREGVFVGEGIWKWRMQDMVDFEDSRYVNELITKSIQYLSVKDDKRKFRVNNSKNIYRENEPVMLDAQLYNDAFELINTPEVSIVIKNTKGQEYKYSFSKLNNYYVLNPGNMAPGNYNYVATTNFGGNLLKATGKFSVQNIQLELNNLTAQHDVLRQLSENFNGQYLHSTKIASLSDNILENKTLKPILFTSLRTQLLLEKKWFFFLLLLILGLEWFLRRYFGSY